MLSGSTFLDLEYAFPRITRWNDRRDYLLVRAKPISQTHLHVYVCAGMVVFVWGKQTLLFIVDIHNKLSHRIFQYVLCATKSNNMQLC
jgi:hypothetical protein